MYTSFILFFGFLIFTASEFGGTKALGFLMSMTLLVAMICNLILLPTMLMTLEKFINKKEFPEPILDISDEVDVEDYEDEDTLEKENNLA